MNLENIFNKFNNKYIKNVLVLMSDSIIKLVVGFTLSVVVARVFGPSKFGDFNYVVSYVAILQVFVYFGFEGIVLKDFGLKSYDENTIIGTAIKARYFFAFFVYAIGALVFYFFLKKSLIQLYLVYALLLFIYPMHILKEWFQIKSLNKYAVISSQIAFALLCITKILFLIFFKDLRIYAGFFVTSFMLEIIVLIAFYKKCNKNKNSYKFDKTYFKVLFFSSIPLLLQSLASSIYMRIDQVMIGKILSTSELGIYSVSVTIASMVYFIPVAVANGFYPKIAEAKRTGVGYEETIIKTGSINVLICLVFSIGCIIVAPWFIKTFYGTEYQMSGRIIQIHCWASIFVGIGCANSVYLVMEDLQKYYLFASLSGALLNILLNSIFISFWGGYGAAFATVVTQFFASYFFYIFLKDKKTFIIRTKCLLLRNLRK